MLRSVCFLLFLGWCPPAFAAIWHQVPLPISNAQATALATDPSTPGRVFIGLYGIGVVRSDDRGATWMPVGVGQPLDPIPSAVSVSPVDPALVFAGHASGTPSLIRSTDGGTSWADVSPSPDALRARNVVFHALDPSLVLAAFASGAAADVYRSTDQGATWGAVGLGATWALATPPQSPGTFLASTVGAVYLSTDSGTSWALVSTPGDFRELEYGPVDADLVYGVRAGDVFRSTDAGASFSATATPPSGNYVTDLAAHPLVATELVGVGVGYGCNPINQSGAYTWTSTDRGDTWTTREALLDCDVGTHSRVAYDPADAGRLFRTTTTRTDGGFAVSTDDGTSWSARVDGLQNIAVDRLGGSASGVAYASVGERFFRSVARPLVWTERASSPYAPGHFPEQIEVNDADPDFVIETGYFGAELLVQYQASSNDGIDSWNLFGGVGLPPVPNGSFRFFSNHGDAQHVYATVFDELYRSDDGHATYSLVYSSGVPPTLEDIQIDPNDWQRIFVARLPGMQVGLSTDGGVTFVPRDGGLPVSDPVKRVFLDPSDPDHLAAYTYDGEVWQTTNGGTSWSFRTDLLPPSPPYVATTDETWDPTTGSVFVSTLSLGIRTDHPRYTAVGLPTAYVTSVHYSPGTGRLLAATQWDGLWALDLAPGTSAPVPAQNVATWTASPNPFRHRTTFTLATPVAPDTRTRLTVVDVAGRVVRRLTAVGARVTWDGSDESGRGVPAGVYFARSADGRAVRVLRLR